MALLQGCRILFDHTEGIELSGLHGATLHRLAARSTARPPDGPRSWRKEAVFAFLQSSERDLIRARCNLLKIKFDRILLQPAGRVIHASGNRAEFAPVTFLVQ